jgi:CBS domain-containing protein
MNAKDILDSKGRKIFAVTESTTVYEAISELANNKIGLLIVKNATGNISGVLSERDIIQICIYPKKDPGLLRARDIMTPKENIVVAAEEDDIQNLMNTMTEKRIRHLPIFRGQEISGINSIGDIVKSMIEIKDYEIKSLIDYISGNYPR